MSNSTRYKCLNCGYEITGHHYCAPCKRAKLSDDPETALAEVKRKRDAGFIRKGNAPGVKVGGRKKRTQWWWEKEGVKERVLAGV